MPFTPLHSILGGVCIGLSAFHNARLHGRSTNASDALFRLHSSLPSALLVFGLVLSGWALEPFSTAPAAAPLAVMSVQRVAGAGLLAGLGTRLAGGCTAGHGVCGIAQLSVGSIVFLVTFIAVGAIVSSATQLAAVYEVPAGFEVVLPSTAEIPLILGLIAFSAFAPPLLATAAGRGGKLVGKASGTLQNVAGAAVHVALGASLGAGLVVSGIFVPSKVAAFMSAGPGWDPSLPLSFVPAWPIAAAGLHRLKSVHVPVTKRLILGAVLFGLGGGALGSCPPTALVYAGAWPAWRSAVYVASVLVGGHAGIRAADALGI